MGFCLRLQLWDRLRLNCRSVRGLLPLTLSFPWSTRFAASWIAASWLAGVLVGAPVAKAGDIEWSGVYRIEGYHIRNSELNDRSRQKDYGLHHLVLRPKISVADGLTVFGQFHVLNAPDSQTEYANSQMGQVLGGGVRTSGARTGTTNSNDANSAAQRQRADDLKVSNLYLTFNQEFGQLLVGRAPVHFGLGLQHNAGQGLFDHWYDNRDMVAYKIVLGPITLLPMYGKVSEGSVNNSDDVTDWMIQGIYENPENETEMGVFYQVRRSGDQGNDQPAGTTTSDVLGKTGAQAARSQAYNLLSLYVLKDTDRYRLGVEAGFLDGDSGVSASDGGKVDFNGFGLALEAEYRPDGASWNWGLKAGMASGDDPKTADFEGFIFDKNYDVAFLMFNHPLGQRDFLRTRYVGGGPNSGGEVDTTDTEAISNTIYVSPSVQYVWSEQWKIDTRLTTAWLSEDAMDRQKSKDLGYEFDLGLQYEPKKGIQWINQLGLLFPGGAFKGDGSLSSSFAYGFTSKAAISF